ncbi:24110_t:CDS:2 [Gigaspora margarita]|uniref:24110_t:CDS:1 n=1 Tax=Gigaspora margarita TaxID=4874 RepID=A0ABN7URN5_GIGMA|nr:24110_t:CDS:2 [Gigaspora margarita]
MCTSCLANKAKKRIDEKAALSIIVIDYTQDGFESISLKELSDYVAELIESTQENSGLFFKIWVEISDLVEHSLKSIAKMIINYIESASDYKESNQKRIIRFDCQRKLIIHIDVPIAEAEIKLSHNILHERPIIVATPIEIKQEIKKNLHLWSFFIQNFYKSNENHVASAYAYLNTNEAKDCELCFKKLTNKITAIGFITPLFKKMLPVSEVHCDATYKIAKGHFELYALIGNFEGTDKDFSEINAAREVWPEADVQLCLWHIERALKQKLISNKKVQCIQYHPNDTAMKFNFIDPNFRLNLENDAKNYEDWKCLVSKPIAVDAEKHYTIDSACWCKSKIITTNENSRNINIELYQKCEFEIITANKNGENIDPELRQEYDSKIASLEHLVKQNY